MATPNIPQAQLKNHILQALQLIHKPGDVIELRIPDAGRVGTVSGYFNDFNKLADAALTWSAKVPAVYIILNTCDPALLARAANRVKERAEHLTTDKDITCRCWLPVDCDAVRPAGISSTDVEHEAALDRARQIREWLREQNWPEPIFADSGNGAHLLYPIDLPNDQAAKALVEGCLKTLDAFFSDDVVQVDVKTGNAARVWKLYGTMACKGDDTPKRPHRMAKILEVPEVVR